MLGAVLAGSVCRDTPFPSLSVTTPLGSRPVAAQTLIRPLTSRAILGPSSTCHCAFPV